MRLLKCKTAVSCVVIFMTAAAHSLYLPALAPWFLGAAAEGVDGEAATAQARQLLFAVAIAAPQILSAIGAPLCGALSDRYGRRRSLIVALSGAALAMSICAISIILHHAVILIAALALLGLVDGSAVIVQAGLLEESPADHHAADIGHLTACSVLGVVSGSVIGGLCSDERMFEFSTYYLPFLLTAGLFMAAMGVVATWYAEAARAQPARPASRGRYLRELIDTIRAPRIRRYVYILFLLEVIIATFYVRVPVLLQQSNAGPFDLGLYGAYIASVIALTCAVLVPVIPASMPIRASLTGSFVLLTAAGALLLRQPTVPRVWLSGLPFAVGAGIIYCLSLACITERTDPSDQGKLAGITISISALAFLVAGVAMGSAVSSEILAATVAPLVGVVGICVSAFARALHRDRPEPSAAAVA